MNVPLPVLVGSADDDTVRAAGGVVWRARDGRVEIAVVHRQRYDDWSLPKGKLEDGESELAAAVREVGEELGSTVAVSRWIERVAYRYGSDDHPVDKTVAFWLMRHTGGEFVVNDEVDEARWLSPSDAAALLTYDVERGVLDECTSVPFPDSTIALVRHAKAGKRTEWTGDDSHRPLERAGVAQAEVLATFLQHFDPDRIVSAVPVRCVQTVAPLADRLGLATVVDAAFSDDDYVAAPAASEAALIALATPGRATVVCSQGATIPGLVDALTGGLRPTETKKGAVWLLSFVDGVVVAADHYRPR